MINFPFSDFSNFKLRPVLVWENLWNDLIVMPITSSKINIFWEYFLEKNKINNLKINSFVKPFNINTIDVNIIIWKLWKVDKSDIEEINKIFYKKFCMC